MTKVCSKCCCVKPVADFCKQSSSSDGLYPWCKHCRTTYNKFQKKPQKRNPKHRSKEYDKIYAAKYYLDHKDKIKNTASEWRLKNPEKSKIQIQNRRARKLKSNTKLSHGLEDLVLSEQGYMCPGCLCDLRSTKKHMDHYMPLSLGGLHTDNNIQMLCAACNLKKGKKHPMEWLSDLQKPQISSNTSYSWSS